MAEMRGTCSKIVEMRNIQDF